MGHEEDPREDVLRSQVRRSLVVHVLLAQCDLVEAHEHTSYLNLPLYSIVVGVYIQEVDSIPVDCPREFEIRVEQVGLNRLSRSINSNTFSLLPLQTATMY